MGGATIMVEELDGDGGDTGWCVNAELRRVLARVALATPRSASRMWLRATVFPMLRAVARSEVVVRAEATTGTGTQAMGRWE